MTYIAILVVPHEEIVLQTFFSADGSFFPPGTAAILAKY